MSQDRNTSSNNLDLPPKIPVWRKSTLYKPNDMLCQKLSLKLVVVQKLYSERKIEGGGLWDSQCIPLISVICIQNLLNLRSRAHRRRCPNSCSNATVNGDVSDWSPLPRMVTWWRLDRVNVYYVLEIARCAQYFIVMCSQRKEQFL